MLLGDPYHTEVKAEASRLPQNAEAERSWMSVLHA